MRIAIASDHGGFDYKEQLIPYLTSLGHEVKDFGTDSTKSVDYCDFAFASCEAVANGEFDRGILICGTGIGMAMTANKFKGIRAAVCHDIFSTQRSILSNNGNVLCMGERVIGAELAKTLVSEWISLEFKDGPSTAKVQDIINIETENMK